MNINPLRSAIRNLKFNKSFNLLNLLGLAIGMASAGLIYLWVEDEYSFDRHHQKWERLHQVLINLDFDGKVYTYTSTPGPLAPALKAEVPEVQNTCRFSSDQYTLFSREDKNLYERGYYVDSSAFRLFTIPFAQGHPSHVFQVLHSIVISEKMAEKFFPGQDNIIGKSISVNHEADFKITGVFKNQPSNSTLRFDWLMPYEIFQAKNAWLNDWGNNGIKTFIEIKPGIDISGLNNKLDLFIQQKDSSTSSQAFLSPMEDWRLKSNYEGGHQAGGRIQYVRMFSLVAWIILLIACINFMNLATARFEKRVKEVGVRKVLGADRKSLVFQFLGESLFMSFFALAIAGLIVYAVLPGFNHLVGKGISLGLNQPLHLLLGLSVAVVCGLVAGTYPAWYLSSFNPIRVFKASKWNESGSAFIRKGLVVFQFTISILLILGTLIIYKQINHVKSREMGYQKDLVIQSGLTGKIHENFEVIKNEFLASGEVENVALSNLNMLYMGSSTDGFNWEGQGPGKNVLITQDWVSPEYIQTLGLEIKEGRDFYPVAKQDQHSVIINETLAQIINKKNIIGSTIRHDTTSFTIVGVVKDFVYGNMHGKIEPLVFLCYPEYFGYMYIKLKKADHTAQALGKIKDIMNRYNPGYPFNYIFVDDEFNLQFKTDLQIGSLSRWFSVLAIFITCLGLFGLAAHTAERKKKEIGIRKVLGADSNTIARLLSQEFIFLVLIAAVIAFPIGGWMIHDWLQQFPYRVELDWKLFLTAGAMALSITLFTVSYQTIRAALGNPVNALRSE